MKKAFIITMMLAVVTLANALDIQRVEPLSWWTGMKLPLTLMFQGEDLQDAEVTVQKHVKNNKFGPTEGIQIRGQHNAESKNYLFVDVTVNEPGMYRFMLQKGKKKVYCKYIINERREGSAKRPSFTSADCIYLIMSDRFVDGDAANNSTQNTLEKGNKASLDGRWGGDIQGIINSLDYIKSTGATAIWPTPLLLDNEPDWSYHGYACGDYYHIDPRFGSNELYKEMIAQAHAKGLKFLMDIVTNHCGLAHWWMQDLPYQDWVHQFPTFTRSINQFTTSYDPNASQYDLTMHENGWFDTHMPDMNLDNPDLLQYFKQWAIWWVEFADLDGLRVDTYPYNEKHPMSEWCKAVREEYPNLNIVGECWTRPTTAVAYWQAGAKNPDGFNSNLPAVMDFPLEEAIRAGLAHSDARDGWDDQDKRISQVYHVLAQDMYYADVNNVLVFIGNHDMDHIADMVADNDLRRVKLADVLIATMRGIPQVFQGDEYGQRSADLSRGHSGLRRPLMTGDELSQDQKDLLAFHSKLFLWRQNEKVLHKGKTMHFYSENNTYAFFRYLGDEAILVFVNAGKDAVEVPVDHYKEMLDVYGTLGIQPLDGKPVTLKEGLKVPGLGFLIVKLQKGAQKKELFRHKLEM